MKPLIPVIYLLIFHACFAQSPQIDQNVPQAVPIAYLKWYRANMELLNGIPIYTGGPTKRQWERLNKSDKEMVVVRGMIKHGGRRYKFYKRGGHRIYKSI